jgi:hypothetical protein
MSARLLAGSGVLLIALAAPAAAQDVPTIQPLKPCYVTAGTATEPQAEGFDLTATGFTPNSEVKLQVDDVIRPGGEALKVNEFGVLTLDDPVPAPFVATGMRDFTVKLTELANPANVATATAKTTALGVTLKPLEAPPWRRIRFKGLGFTKDKPIWAHYIHKGKLRKTVRMARRPGECGGFRARRRQIPIKHPRLGRWIVQFDQSKRFVDPKLEPIVFVRVEIRLRLVPR